MNRSQGYYPLIEEGVVEFLNTSRTLQFPITKDIIRLQAEQVWDKILSCSTLDNDTKQRIKSFKPSAGCCSRFTSRYQIKSRVLYVFTRSAKVEQAAPLMQNTHEHLSDYPVHRVFNVGEKLHFSSSYRDVHKN